MEAHPLSASFKSQTTQGQRLVSFVCFAYLPSTCNNPQFRVTRDLLCLIEAAISAVPTFSKTPG
jgi:hypothetical protein